MVRKLISSLTAKIGWRLLFKSLAGLLALLVAGFFRFSFLGIAVLLAVAAWAYFSESVERTARRGYFLLLTLWAWIAGAGLLAHQAFPTFYLAAAVYAALLYLWLGDVHLLWPKREVMAGVGEAGLFAAWSAAVFYVLPAPSVTAFWGNLWLAALVFMVAATLMREAFRFEPVHFPRRERLLSWSAGLLAAETAALLAFLPLGYLNAAAALTLIFVVMKDVFLAHYRGHLNIDLIFREIAVLAVFLVIIFAVVPWALQ